MSDASIIRCGRIGLVPLTPAFLEALVTAERGRAAARCSALLWRSAGPTMRIAHRCCHSAPDAAGVAEIGYTIAPSHRGRGYATEAAACMLRWAASRGARRFRASVAPDNTPSLAVVARLGFVRTGEQIDEIDGLEWVFEREGAPERAP